MSVPLPSAYKYDLAVSFASEQRGIAAPLAGWLDASGYSIFYDEFQEGELFGEYLSLELRKIYADESRYCLIILSKKYLEKPWTKLEREAAISEFSKRKGDYILCLKIDDVELPGLPSDIAYLTLDKFGIDGVYKLLLEKLGPPHHDHQLSNLDEKDRQLARNVIEACFRRSIYSRMASEISLRAMYDSIGKAIAAMQRLTPRIDNPALQFTCGEIINALDDIDRVRTKSDAQVSNNLQPQLGRLIDDRKQKIVRLLLEIRRAAQIPMQLPFALNTDDFFSPADEPPAIPPGEASSRG